MRRPGGGFRGMRSPFGGGLQFGPGGSVTPVVRNLLIANAILFLGPALFNFDTVSLARNFGFVPADVLGSGKLWQFFTYMFLHGSFGHIFFNMLMLWMFGTTIERAWGSQPFLWYYIVCGLGGAITTWVTGPGSTIPTIGASAAVLGLLLAYGMMFPDRQVYIYFLFPIKMKYLVWILAGLNMFAAFDGRQDGIAHFAHLGGMLFGWLYLKQDWRLGSMGRKMRAHNARQKMAANARRAEQTGHDRDEQVREVNRILEKISREGMDSLSPEELRTLREASGR